MIIDRLNEQNPWWQDRHAIESDRHLKRANQASYSWVPPLVDDLDLTKPNVYTIRGPRQVGKTTTVKFLIHRLLNIESQWPRLLYYSLDLERDPKAIVDIVTEAKALFPRESGPWCLFLDEISSVPDWSSGIKYLRDQTSAAEDCFILTGSSAADIRSGGEQLTGRRGPDIGLDRILLPLSFSDFCAVQGIPGGGKPSLTPHELLDKESNDALQEGMRFLMDLGRALEAYVVVGGFPRAIDDYLTLGHVSEASVRTLWDMLVSDVDRQGFDRLAALIMLDRSVRSLGTPTSWRGLADEMAIGSHHMAQRYATLLSEAFALLVVYYWDRGRGRISLRKNKKLYPVDPLLAAVPRVIQPASPSPPTGAMVEGVVAASLYRAAEPEPVGSLSLPQSLFYWRSSKGKEIDFLSGSARQKVPIEVKYQQTISGADKLVIRNSFGRGILLSSRDLILRDPVRVIPAPLFLWFLRTQP